MCATALRTETVARPTDRQADSSKAICPIFFERGLITNFNINDYGKNTMYTFRKTARRPYANHY